MYNLFLVVMLFAAFAATTLVQTPNVQAAEIDYNFDCRVPWWGEGRCGNYTYTMSPGKYVKVKLDYLSDSCANFKLYNADNSNFLGSTHVCDGETELVWTNTLGYTVNVYFQADADHLGDARLVGLYKFGWY